MGNDAFRRRMLEATAEDQRQAAAIKRRIAKLYEQAAEDMASKAASSKAGSLTEAFARSLSNSLRERCQELWREIGDLTKAGMASRAERMVGVQTAFLADAARRAELDLKPTLQRVFASVSDDAVRHVLQGGLYGGNAPTLSKRIWRNAAMQNGQIEQVITGALAKKQSAVQLARSLEAYLKPNIVQPDNWNDIYPDMPFVYKVDYNAKRLAVTSINHAGWAATISAARKNPYADYLHWELTPAHVITDVCDGYAEHDDGLGLGNWPINAAPLPHPFCTCLWYVDTDKTLDEIGRELRAWEDGESNERLDRAFGEWEKKYTSAPNSGIINTERARRFHRFTDKDGKEIYQYPETGEIQALSSTAEISGYFAYQDIFSEKCFPVDKSFSLLSLDTQKEIAEGVEYVRKLFDLTRLPKQLAVGTPKIAKTYATYSELEQRIVFSQKRLTQNPEQAFPTAVHEMAHFFDHIYGGISNQIVQTAFKRMNIRSNSRIAQDLRQRTVGVFNTKDKNNNAEVFAYAIERQATNRGNALTEMIEKIVLEEIEK